jgi:hypothetical protein
MRSCQESKARKIARKTYKKFRRYLKENGKGKARRITARRLATQLTAFAGSLMSRYKWSSIRTTLGHVIGEFQRKKDKKVLSLRVKDLMKSVEAQMRESGVKKAPPITSAELAGVYTKIKATAREKLMLETLVRTCIRMGNLKELRHMQVGQGRWTFILNRHKTRSKGVHGAVQMRTQFFSRELQTLLSSSQVDRLLFGEEEIKALQKKLSLHKIRTHGFRRGGIRELYARGVTLERIRQLTLHTSDAQVLEYLGEAELE